MHNQLKHLCAVILLVIVTVVAMPNAQPTQVNAQTEEYKFLQSWGDEADRIYPSDIALSPDGRYVYATDPKYHRVIIVDRFTKIFTTFGNYGTGDGGFIYPNGIAVDKNGYLYVADYGNRTVQKFTSTGQFVRIFLSPLADSYLGPHGIAIDDELNIYIVDWRDPMPSNPRIIILSKDGNLLGLHQSCCDMNYAYQQVNAMDVDENGNIFLTDTQDDRILNYTNTFQFIRSWGSQGNANGQFWKPKGVGVDKNGFVYIADTNNHRIQIFDSKGVFIRDFGSLGSDIGEFSTPKGISVDSFGNIYVADTENRRIQKFSNDGHYITQFGEDNYTNSLDTPSGISIDQYGNVYVADTMNHQIQKFNQDGTFIKSWGGYGINSGQFFKPYAVAVDIRNNVVYVADTYNFRIQKFSLDGDYLLQWGDSQKLGVIYGIAVDSSGNVLIADGSKNKIRKYSPLGALLKEWGEQGSAEGQLNRPQGIALDSLDNVYVTEEINHRVSKFDKDGVFLNAWPVQAGVFGIVVKPNGNILITNITYNQLFEYSGDGSLLATIGVAGNNPGQFFYPFGLVISMEGDLFITDSFNNRIQKFSLLLPFDSETGLIVNGNFNDFAFPKEWTYGGEISPNIIYDLSVGSNVLQLGHPVPSTEQGEGDSWAYQTIFVDPNYYRPLLSFRYNLFVNDIIDYSDFLVEIQDGAGRNHLDTVIHDGFQPCRLGIAPVSGTNLGWRTKTYDLSAYKGQYIRIVFSNRNLWPESWGIWTYVDDVKVIDAGPLPISTGSVGIYLPLITTGHCDPVPTTGIAASSQFRNLP